MKNWKYIPRALIGAMFVFSAVTKLLSIDSFEIYVFSFGFLPLWAAYLSARLLIAFEAFLGIWMLINCDAKPAWWTGMVLLAGFTLRLAILLIQGNTDSCNCFGDFADIKPLPSILKNLAFMAVLGISYGCKSFNIKRKWLWRISVPVVCLATVLVLSPPDNWRYKSFSSYTTINTEAFEEAQAHGEIPDSLFSGDRILCLYSLKCDFCKMSAQKLAVLRKRGEFSESPVSVAFGGDDTPERREEARKYLEETGLVCEGCFFISPSTFLKITNGQMPLILILKDGVVTAKYSYRDLH